MIKHTAHHANIESPTARTIALEGGPCAGKTTVLNHMVTQAVYSETNLIVLPEVASEYIQENNVDIPWLAQYDRSEFLRVETEILDMIVDGITRARSDNAGHDVVIVADRCDIASYVEPEEYQQIIRRLGFTAAPHLRLVDQIAYLPSVAQHDALLYEKLMSSNESRYENATAAQQTCDRNRNTLAMHPGFEVFDETDFDARIRSVTDFVLAKSHIHYMT